MKLKIEPQEIIPLLKKLLSIRGHYSVHEPLEDYGIIDTFSAKFQLYKPSCKVNLRVRYYDDNSISFVSISITNSDNEWVIDFGKEVPKLDIWEGVIKLLDRIMLPALQLKPPALQLKPPSLTELLDL